MIQELFALTPKQYGRYDEIVMIPYLVEQQGFSLVIYGAGDCGKYIFDWLRLSYHIKADYFLDISEYPSYCGTKVLPLETFIKLKIEKCVIIISQMAYKKSAYIRTEIDETMGILKSNIKKCLVCYGSNLYDNLKIDWYYYIKDNVVEFEKTYELLEDKLSKETFIEFLKTHIIGSRYAGKTMPEEYKYWGGDSGDRLLFKMTKNEVFLNIGACCGDTIYQYLKSGNPYKKIIAVEGDRHAYGLLKRNIFLLNEDTKKTIRCDNYMLGQGENTIDNLYQSMGVSLINMDIEGAELSVLKTAERLIRENRPVMSICVYHKKDDLVTIPKYINHLVDEYVFLLRKYPSGLYPRCGFDGVQQSNELVLYAIPKERYIVDL